MNNLLMDNALRRERWYFILLLKKILDPPMTILAFVWLFLTILDLTRGLPSYLERTVFYIWMIFWIHFIVEFSLAPKKTVYIKHNWLTALSLIIPAIRSLRVFSSLKFLLLMKGTTLLRILSTLNRGMNALSKNLGKRGFKYVFLLTMIVVFLSAAGMMIFEEGHSHYFSNYSSALWWTSMMVTTMGTDYFPKSSEGRLLALLLAIYGFAIFGYVTATVATIFVAKDEKQKDLNTLKKSDHKD